MERLTELVLRHRLERFDVMEPEVDHVSATTPAWIGIRADSNQGSSANGLPPIHVGRACGRCAADMRIGDPVIYQGRRYVLRGLDPMSVPDRRAHLEDCETGELIRVPVAKLTPA